MSHAQMNKKTRKLADITSFFPKKTWTNQQEELLTTYVIDLPSSQFE